MYDEEFVLVETLTGEQRLDDPDEVAVYIKAFDQLRDAAAIGPGRGRPDPEIMADFGR